MHVPVQKDLATAKIRQKKAAAELNIAEDAVLVASTGVIGMQLPIQKLESGIEVMAKELSDTREAAHQAACAIMTTDTISKEVAVTFGSERKNCYGRRDVQRLRYDTSEYVYDVRICHDRCGDQQRTLTGGTQCRCL